MSDEILNQALHDVREGDQDASSAHPFQSEVVDWISYAFDEDVRDPKSRPVRGLRFAEECAELARDAGVSFEDYVNEAFKAYQSKHSNMGREVGGVMLTLAGLCESWGLDMQREGEKELRRVWDDVENVRERNKTKRHP